MNKIKDVVHYVLELQAERGKQFVFNQEIIEAIDEVIKEPMYYKARENLIEIRDALVK